MNKNNFTTAVEQKSNIIYINVHAEYIYQTMQILGENKEGRLEKLIFS